MYTHEVCNIFIHHLEKAMFQELSNRISLQFFFFQTPLVQLRSSLHCEGTFLQNAQGNFLRGQSSALLDIVGGWAQPALRCQA